MPQIKMNFFTILLRRGRNSCTQSGGDNGANRSDIRDELSAWCFAQKCPETRIILCPKTWFSMNINTRIRDVVKSIVYCSALSGEHWRARHKVFINRVVPV